MTTAVTVSLGTPKEMAAATRKLAGSPLIKVKLGGEGDAERIKAVCEAAGNSRIILDANEAWRKDMVQDLMLVAAKHGVALIEQPLPAGADDYLRSIPHPVPICADESAHSEDDLWRLRELYDCINIKLDKAGGLTAGFAMQRHRPFARLFRDGGLHGGHVALHGPGGAAGAGRRICRPRRPADPRQGPPARPALLRRQGIPAKTEIVGVRNAGGKGDAAHRHLLFLPSIILQVKKH